MITQKDYIIAAASGFLTGIFVSVVLFFLKIELPISNFLIPFLIAFFWAFGVWLGGFLGRRIAPFFAEFSKFAATGFLSASIDFSILNFISYLTGITAGVVVGWINIPGFLVAVVNGYLWNKLWVFKDAPPSSTLGVGGLQTPSVFPAGELFHDFPKFFAVTLVGLLINSGLIIVFTTYISNPFGVPPQIWLNIAKIFANAVAMIWNFIGYKFFAFSAKGGK